MLIVLICFNRNFILFTYQDVLSTMGTPSNVFYKSEELSKLYHNENLLAQALSPSNNNQFDYFYNYTTLGLVSKIVFASSPNQLFYFFLLGYFVQCRHASYIKICFTYKLSLSL